MPPSNRGYQRILVIGSGGAGKSTLATRLARRLGLPLIRLDALFWRAGWNPTPRDEWEQRVRALASDDAWVMDGNYGGTLDLRLARCDTVVFVDLPRLLCLWRVVKRSVRYAGRTRPDMGAGCRERLTREFVQWIWHYPARQRPKILARLALLRTEKTIVILRSPRAVREFLAMDPAPDSAAM